ncbi:FG-GAP-like repeat-containing protein [Actomonas aquatica]|uniref:FG-GAP-like repeat-containing protein n=1 Tax=Actomonas aquatica TaxID=2866162 RepID=A0ABZ1C4E8_9BACT|nr:FG-GAP-like repeat-containing protein [Opitutus sp. WL0086]WRQ86361.1 FG-GAP-like repeat-containing protein [Opitutus sp. WL0086]
MKTSAPATLALLALTPFALLAAEAQLASTPLAPRSGDGSAMCFTAIPAAASGLINENPYDDPAMWTTAHYTEFQGGSIGSGIASGDIDGDGLVDLYVVNKVRPNQLFRQVAPFRFEDITTSAGVAGTTAWNTGATLADIDNDGDLDLYVCQFNAPNLLFINDGAGHFTEEAAARGADLTSASVVGAFADYDRDGHLDLFVLTNVQRAATHPDGEADVLLRNRGDGTFEDVTLAAGLASVDERGHSASWFDANADGWPDLYITNDFAKPDHLYQNNGDGTFTDTADRDLPATPWFAMGSDFGDINNDGLFDLFAADMAGTTHYKSKVTMGDMGGLVDTMDRMETPQYMRNFLYLNSGTDRFFEIAQMAGVKSSDWTWSPRFEDLDNDGFLDLHITNGMVRSFIDSDLINTARRLHSPAEVIRLMKNSPPLKENHLTLRNDGHLHFKKVQKDWGLDHEGISFGSTFADFDRDGDLDLAYVNYDASVSLYRNDSPAGHRVILELVGTSSNARGVGTVATIDAPQGKLTRMLSVARGVLSSSEPILHFGLGDTTTIPTLTVRWPSGIVQTFTDLPADRRYTLTEPTANGTTPPPAVASRPVDHGLLSERAAAFGLDHGNIEQPYNDMLRQSLLPNRMNTLDAGLALGDANGDGRLDVFFSGSAGQPGALYLAEPDGRYRAAPGIQPWQHAARSAAEHMAPLWFDLDADGDLDLIVSTGSTEFDAGNANYRAQLYLNDGEANFTVAPADQFNPLAASSAAVAAADFDRDGDLDLFIGGRVVPGAYPSHPESQLFENRDGQLVDVTPDALRHIGMVTAALWTDADADDRLDLLLIGEWMAPTVFSYDGTTLALNDRVSGLAEHRGWWNSLLAADVDADGDLDYVAGNFGHNTKYHPSPDHPVEMFYGDFEDSGTCEIVEAKYEGDRLLPVRGRSCSSRAMPTLAQKFPTFHDFGSAVLPEIYTPEKLDESLHLQVTELGSGVFINQGQGRFTFAELPHLAQTAPIFGLAAADFTGDGLLDLVGLQNFQGPQVETGWYNGGLSVVLAGDGRGHFTPLTPQQSGLAIPGEARAAALADLDGDARPELLVTRLNTTAQVYAPTATTASRPLTVRLHDRATIGNAAAIGAKLTLTLADGSTPAIELTAGAAHLAQSAPVAYFSIPATTTAETLTVRWPDGSRTTHRVPADATTLDLGRPDTAANVAQTGGATR